MTARRSTAADVVIRGAQYAAGPGRSMHGDLSISRGRIHTPDQAGPRRAGGRSEFDLSGYFLLPGLINAHDHLEFALYPKLGQPPYRNYIEWGEDIHARFADLIACHHRVPKTMRLWWGGLRNLLCGVTTVCHHNPLDDELRRSDFPVRVVQQYGWAHSVALGGDLRAVRAATPAGWPFIIHACEGVDVRARDEVQILNRLGLLDDHAVLVHGLALDCEKASLLRHRGASLILCPSSNFFLFDSLPDLRLLATVPRLALGSDSPLTAKGDLLDEIRFAVSKCGIPPDQAYRMVTSQAASILRLRNGEGLVREGGVADLIAIAADGRTPGERLETLSARNIDLVLIAGIIQLASEPMLERLPPSAAQGLEPILVGDVARWVRAPVSRLLQQAEAALGAGQVFLGGRAVQPVRCREAKRAC